MTIHENLQAFAINLTKKYVRPGVPSRRCAKMTPSDQCKTREGAELVKIDGDTGILSCTLPAFTGLLLGIS